MYHKCCIVNCGSRKRRDINLYKFPKNETSTKKWLNFINCPKLFTLSFEVLRNYHVCKKHFEPRFFSSSHSRSRLYTTAYPTLFTDEEIATGIPQSNLVSEGLKSNGLDHAYAIKRQHEDHSYSSIEKVTNKSSTIETGKPQPHASVDNNASSNSQEVNHDEIYSRRNIPAVLCPRPETEEDTEAGLSGQDAAETIEYDNTEESQKDTGAPEEVKETHFSWMKPVEVIDDNEPAEPPPPDPVPSINLEVDSYSQEQDQEMFPKDKEKEGEGGDSHPDYQCNICGKDISGFRYVCVQCVDFDLCASCEYMRGHDQHYVLRVPQPRPNSEVLFVLRTIRRALVMDAIVDVAGTDHQRPHCDVEEVKEELEDPIAQEHPENDYFDIDNDYRIDAIATGLNQNPEEDESGTVRNESTWHKRHRNDSEINTSIGDDFETVENDTNEAENLDPLEGTSHTNTGSFSLSLQPTDSNLFEIVMDKDQTVDQEIVISATETKKPRKIHTLILHTDTAKQKTNKRKVLTFLKVPTLNAKPRNIAPISYQSATRQRYKTQESDLPETFTEEEYLDEYFEVYPENANIVPRADSIQSRLQPTAAVSSAGDKQLPPTRIKMTTKEAHAVLERLRAAEVRTALKRKRRHNT
ncbi:THAP domain-containing protein [Phthorimaea operculella]|nr:THAP domain-containing protein [Phthorimaea operculella]